MAILKLLVAPDSGHADGSHHVGSPGGYEVWHFYAEDAAGKLRIVIEFHDGFGLNGDYLNRYAAYRRRPTRNVPPTPSEYPYLLIRIIENGKTLTGCDAAFPANSFQANSDGSLVLGTNRVEFNPENIKLIVSDLANSLAGELRFQPILPATAGNSFSVLKAGDAEHHWIAARPLCQVQGEIRAGQRTISFSGLGQHNHYFGTAPMLWSASRSMRGCVLFPQAAVMFQTADDRAIVLMADQSGVRPIDAGPMDIEWKRFLIFGNPRPAAIRFGEGLIFRNPRVVGTLGSSTQLLFDAYVFGEQATAWVEIDDRG